MAMHIATGHPMKLELKQIHRDLQWVIEAPPLMSQTASASFLPKANRSLVLQQWWQNLPDTLLEAIRLALSSARLGIYYELLTRCILSHAPNYQLLAYNWPIYANQRTLGALDFLYLNQQQLIHRETAVKFYLGVPNASPANPNYSTWDQWWGPNQRDRLDLKVKRLLTHQLPIAQHAQAQHQLQAQSWSITQQEIDLKGYLFYPLHTQLAPPQHSHPEHLRGYWLPWDAVEQIIPYAPYWKILHRLEWLAPLLGSRTDLTCANELKKALQQHCRLYPGPVLIAGYSEQDGHYLEQIRLFITPNHWPNTG